MSNPRLGRSLRAALLAVLVALSSCSDSPPGSAPPSLVMGARSSADAARAYFESACAACHDEGPRSCLVEESFARGRLGQRFDEIPAHRGITVPERMRRALRLCADAD